MLIMQVKVQDALGTWREEKFSRSVSTYTYQLSAFAEAIASGNYNGLLVGWHCMMRHMSYF